MWVIRILTGPQAGKVIPVKEGTNIIGRAPHCAVKVDSSGISKEHAKVDILNGKIIVSDMKSRNGTYVDGVKVSSKSLREKQKFALNDIILDVVRMNVSNQQYLQSAQGPRSNPRGHNSAQGNVAAQYQNHMAPPAAYENQNPQHLHVVGQNPQAQAHDQSEPGHVYVKLDAQGIQHFIKKYVDDVVLPGVYALAEKVDFKTLLALFVGSFIVFVTLFSSIPLMRILTDSIEKESMERATTIARTVAEINKQTVSAGNTSALTVQFARNEIGVKEVYIVDALDKMSVMAPANKAGQYAFDIPFAPEVITRGQSEGVKKVNDDTIVAVVGIPVYNAQTGSNQNQAYAIVVYNMGQLAVSGSKTISLLVQTLFIALIVGSILFFFMYRVIVHPIRDVNSQLDKALNENSANVASAYDFPDLQSLISNINSSLSRMGQSSDNGMAPIEIDRSREMENLVNLIGFPAIAIKLPDLTIQSVNPGFEERTNMPAQDLLYGSLDNILDQALKLNIQDLVQTVQAQPDDIAVNHLDIGGESYEVSAQGVHGIDSLSYIIVSLLPPLEGGDE